MNLIERAEAAQKTFDFYQGKPLVWGKFDCVQMAISHARRCGKRVKVPEYGDPLSGARALKTMGFRTLGECMDNFFERIDPSRHMIADFIEMPGGCSEVPGDIKGFTTLSVAVGNGRVIGWHESIGFADTLQPILISGAWTVG